MTAPKKSTFGKYLRNKRLMAEMSLREVAAALGVSAVYVGEVERGVRGPMKEERWPDLVEAIPHVTLEDLRRTAEVTAGIQLDLSEATPNYRNLAHALARRFREQNLTERQVRQILDVIEEPDD